MTVSTQRSTKSGSSQGWVNGGVQFTYHSKGNQKRKAMVPISGAPDPPFPSYTPFSAKIGASKIWRFFQISTHCTVTLRPIWIIFCMFVNKNTVHNYFCGNSKIFICWSTVALQTWFTFNAQYG